MIIEDVYYENSSGDVVSLFSNTIRANFKDARPFQYSVSNDELFNQGKDFQMLVLSVGRQYIDDLVSLLHKDIVANTNGKLFINGWYLYCRYTGIRTIAHESSGFVKVEISFHAPSLLWSRQIKYDLTHQSTFEPQDELNTGDNYLDMDYDFLYDLGNDGMPVSMIYNTETEDADLIINVKADDTEFEMSIMGDGFSNVYAINQELSSANVLTIDGETKKVEYAGVDVFSAVDDDSNIFRAIPTGEFVVAWGDAGYDVEIIVVEHRSVPLWII